MKPNKVLQFINKNNLFNNNHSILITVSGGIDSMVMSHILFQNGYNISLAHCNFHLRGEESDGDQKMVEKFAKENNIPLYVKHFDTVQFAKENQLSIEMAARELRYNWFYNLVNNKGFDKIATGHHRDDLLETFFLNLHRGAGIKGLSGIPTINNLVVRPMLGVSRNEIEAYAHRHSIPYREDSTNKDTCYMRNKIRHNVLPVLDQFSTKFREKMSESISHLQGTERLLNDYISLIKENIIKYNEQRVSVSITDLLKYPHPKDILFEILYPYGFTPSSIENIYKALTLESGKQFLSPNYTLIKDREFLYILPIQKNSIQEYTITAPGVYTMPMYMSIEIIEWTAEMKIDKDPSIFLADADKLEFPIVFRHWKQGDLFYPIGMKGRKKKLSDFFIDQKFSLDQKENCWILCDSSHIAWIVGHRMDDRYKLNPSTKNAIKIEIRK